MNGARLIYRPDIDECHGETRSSIGTWQTVCDETGRPINFEADFDEDNQRGLAILAKLRRCAEL